MSPAPGRLDEDALAAELAEDPDAALSLLAELTGATDQTLARLARQLAARVMVRMARSGAPRRAGTGRLASAPLEPGSDLDLDASLDEVVRSAGSGQPADPEGLRVRRWIRPARSLCLLVDRSGSMGGGRLAAAALAAAAVACRAPGDYSVVAFADDTAVIKAQEETRPLEVVVGEVLALRGHGPTNLARALEEAGNQLTRSPAVERVTVLLSDCRSTAGPDPARAARSLDRLAVVAPAADCAEAEELARRTGARLVRLRGPAEIPAALNELLGA